MRIEDIVQTTRLSVSYPHLLALGDRLSRAAAKVHREPSLWVSYSTFVQSDTVSEALSRGIGEQRQRAAVTASTIEFIGDAMPGMVKALKAADLGLSRATGL